MKQEYIDQWKKTKEKGFVQFMLRHGLTWGIMVYLLLEAVDYAKSKQFEFDVKELIVWLFAGVFYSVFMWFYQDWLYLRKDK